MKVDLSGRTALVTGGSRGIGRAIAEALAAAGATVAVHGLPDHAAEAHGVAAALPGGMALTTDLALPGAGQALAQRCPSLDILVLSAAVEIRAPWAAIQPADVDLQLAVNLREQLGLIQAVLPGMVERGWGRVLAIGSVQSARPNPDLLVYAATKSAMVSMARNLARQVAASGVTVNVLSPGAIETARNTAVLADPAYRDNVLRGIPAGRLGQPSDCAGPAVFLCSDHASYITGTEMRVDGGMSF